MRHTLVALFMFCIVAGSVFSQEAKSNGQQSYRVEDGVIVRSMDGGETWSKYPSSPDDVVLVSYHPEPWEHLLVATTRTVYFLDTRTGVSYQTMASAKGFTPVRMKQSSKRKSEVWMVGSIEEGRARSKILFSMNGGASWNVACTSPEPAEKIHLDPDDARKYWVEQGVDGKEHLSK